LTDALPAEVLAKNLGFQVEAGLTGALRKEGTGGTHGHLPEHVELRASFFLAGPDIAHA
jgi:hypothetical protein